MSSEAIQAKIARILDYIGTLEDLKDNCVERMKSDKVYRGSVLYYLYIVADSCVALAEMVIKHKGCDRRKVTPKPSIFWGRMKFFHKNLLMISRALPASVTF